MFYDSVQWLEFYALSTTWRNFNLITYTNYSIQLMLYNLVIEFYCLDSNWDVLDTHDHFLAC